MDQMHEYEYYVASPPPRGPEEWRYAAQALLVVACAEVEQLRVPFDEAVDEAGTLIGHQAVAEQLRLLSPQTIEKLTYYSLRTVVGITGVESPEEIARLHNNGALTFTR